MDGHKNIIFFGFRYFITVVFLGMVVSACYGDLDIEMKERASGAFYGSSNNVKGETVVLVDISRYFIRDIKIISQPDATFPHEAEQQLISEVISKQYPKYVKLIPGAEVTSKAILDAIQDAVNKSRGKQEEEKYDQVAILYSVGRNELDFYLQDDIQELENGNIPSINDKKVFLVICQYFLTPSDTRGIFDSNPYLIRLYRDNGTVVRDTLKAFPMRKEDGSINLLTDPSVMTETISLACDMFKSDSYGMIFSSHGSGWIPKGYYKNPVPPSAANYAAGRASGSEHPLPAGATEYVPWDRDPSLPMTKSFGEQLFVENLKSMALESDIIEMVNALPVHFDYIMFDSCLMGTIEVAYQFKDICDMLVFSPAEILTEGFVYEKMADRLFGGDKPDIIGVAKDYFEYYNAQKGAARSATITVVDCRKLDELASLCSDLFADYADGIAGVNPNKVGYYFSSSLRCWFYDLESVLLESGLSKSDKERLESTLANVAPYRAATKEILGFIDVKVYSGFSMYLPKKGSDYLDGYYRTLEWNKATGLVK